MDLSPYILALEERLGEKLPEPFRDALALVLTNGRKVRAQFDAGRAEVVITAPVPFANDGLPAELLKDLLKRNFSGDETAGAMLQVRAGQDFLELVNVIPLNAMDPVTVASIMLNQALAAGRLSDWIGERSSSPV